SLNTIVGVFNKRGKGLMDTMARITVRGMPGQQRTLILLDGLTLNDAYSGGVRWGGFSPEDIEKIEVARGPYSSLYGGYAMGGVVNLMTKLPDRREIILKTGYGSSWDRGKAMDDLRKFYFSYGDKFRDKVSFFLSFGHKATNGYPSDFNVQSKLPPQGITGWSYTSYPNGTIAYLIGDRGDNRWWDDNITFKLGYEFSKNSKIDFTLIRVRYEYNYDDPHTYLRNATSGGEVWSYSGVGEASFLSGGGGRVQNIYRLNYENEFGKTKTKVLFGIVDTEKSWYVTPQRNATRLGGPGTVSEQPSRSYSLDIQLTLPLFERHLVTVGGAFRHSWADIREFNATNWKDEKSKTNLTYQSKGKDNTFALFVQDEIQIFENFIAYFGFRADWWKTYDGYTNQIGTIGYPKKYDSRDTFSFNPKTSFVYKPFEKTVLRASIGKAFRPPTVYELYRTWTTSRGITYAGNPTLKPERSISWDFGIDQELWKGAKFKATYYENYIKDLIYTKTVNATYREKINAGKAISKGIECEVEQNLIPGFKLFANFTYTNAKIKKNEAKPESEGKRLTDIPEKMFNLGLVVKKGSFTASITGRYVGKQYNDDENRDTVNKVYGSYDPYFVTDVKVSYNIKEKVTLSISIDNLFDREYYSYYKAPGRSWFGELTLRF
ncbi:MAG: TonB-dependent receptor, partial [Caldimicrobium sp.]